MSENIILIPARYNSERFPGKPLASICGKPMIQWVYEHCTEAQMQAYVVTDNSQIQSSVESFGGHCLRVDEPVQSGSDRIQLAYERYLKAKMSPAFLLNVQGDEPLLRGQILRQLVEFHARSDFDITTLVRRREMSEAAYHDPSVVKAIWNEEDGACAYFSRAPIPYLRASKNDSNAAFWFHHIGVYCYKPEALEKFCRSEASSYEKLEGLEQLRALSIGLKIGAIVIQEPLVGVDTPEDIAIVEGVLGRE